MTMAIRANAASVALGVLMREILVTIFSSMWVLYRFSRDVPRFVFLQVFDLNDIREESSIETPLVWSFWPTGLANLAVLVGLIFVRLRRHLH